MTCKEKLKLDYPCWTNKQINNIIYNDCPSTYGYLGDPVNCIVVMAGTRCEDCWEREIPEIFGGKTMTNDTINLIRRLLGQVFNERQNHMLRVIDDENSLSSVLDQCIEEYREINKAVVEFNDLVEKQNRSYELNEECH